MIGRTLMYHQQQNKWYPKGFHLPISKLHSILAVANLIAHNDIWLCYYGQVKSLGVPFILLLMVNDFKGLISLNKLKNLPINGMFMI